MLPGGGAEQPHFVTEGFASAFDSCLLRLGRLLCPPPRLDVTGHGPPDFQQNVPALPGESILAPARQQGAGGRPPSSQSLFVREPGPQLSPGVRSIMPRLHSIRRAQPEGQVAHRCRARGAHHSHI